MITFTANPNETILSTSYYLQKTFNQYRGTETLPIENTKGGLNPLWWASSIDSNTIYLKVSVPVRHCGFVDCRANITKVINSGNTSVPLSVDIDVPYSSVNGTIIVSHVCESPSILI